MLGVFFACFPFLLSFIFFLSQFLSLYEYTFSFTVFFCVIHIYIFFFTYLVPFVYCAMKLFRVCYVLYYILRKCAQIHDEDFFKKK